MNILNEIIKKNKAPEDLAKISKILAPLIDKTANNIFRSHCQELLEKPITYIIPAIWGKNVNGGLTLTQSEINDKIVPVIEKILELFEFKNSRGEQEFALEYLLRGLFVSKITFMIELMKNIDSKAIAAEKAGNETLSKAITIGSA
ncbi:MAG: hypothetical protein GY797_05840 [Deltaproteobacteria bacterium]|nr:hypothetical protein [Deltaproteobacteria bacterium]